MAQVSETDQADVGFGSLAEVSSRNREVRFTPAKPTQSGHRAMSVSCHVWTAPGWQEETSRRGLGRCCHVFGLEVRFT